MLARKNLVLVIGLAVVLSATSVWGETIPLSPIALNGFNKDIIFGASDSDTGYAVGLGNLNGDGGCFIQNGATLKSTLFTTGGLPTGDFQSAQDSTHIYRLGPAGSGTESDNVLNFRNGSGTLNLASPGKYDHIGVLACSAWGPSKVCKGKLNYSDGSIDFEYNAWDWGSSSYSTQAAYTVTIAAGANNETGACNSAGETYPSRNLYETVIPADPNRILNSITFYNTDVSTNICTAVFAVSGHQAIPEPSTLALLASGLVGLLAYAWRKRR